MVKRLSLLYINLRRSCSLYLIKFCWWPKEESPSWVPPCKLVPSSRRKLKCKVNKTIRFVFLKMKAHPLRCIISPRLGATCPNNYNPADYFVQMLAVIPGRELACRHAIKTTCDTFRNSEYGRKIVAEAETVHGEFESSIKYTKDPDRSPYKASWCEQFRAVLWRSWLSVIKEPILIKVRLLQTVVRFSPVQAQKLTT